jgi:hypothetical protein
MRDKNEDIHLFIIEEEYARLRTKEKRDDAFRHAPEHPVAHSQNSTSTIPKELFEEVALLSEKDTSEGEKQREKKGINLLELSESEKTTIIKEAKKNLLRQVEEARFCRANAPTIDELNASYRSESRKPPVISQDLQLGTLGQNESRKVLTKHLQTKVPEIRRRSKTWSTTGIMSSATPLAITVCSIVAILALLQVDAVVNGSLYTYGLQFDVEWANSYWVAIRTALALLWFIFISSIAIGIYRLTPRNRRVN